MAAGRIYTATSNLVTYTGTSATPVFYGLCASTNPCDILCIRIGSYAGGGVSYPTNGTLLPQLSRATGTESGGTAVTAAPHNAGDIAANTTFKDATGSAITGLTQGVTLWQQPLVFSAGSNWSEWVTPGAEWRVAASAAFAVYLTASAAGTATQFSVEVVFAE